MDTLPYHLVLTLTWMILYRIPPKREDLPAPPGREGRQNCYVSSIEASIMSCLKSP